MSNSQFLDDKIAMNAITLAFGDRALEQKYIETYRRNSIRTILTYTPWMAIILTVCMGVFFWIYQFQQSLLYLYCCGMVSMGGIYLHFRYFPPSYRLLEIIIAIAAVGFGWYDSAFLILLPQFRSFVWIVVAVHMVSTSIALPVRFLTAVVSQSLVLLGLVYIAIVLSDFAVVDAFVQIVLLSGTAGLCFFAAYWREKVLRENFLQQEKIAMYSKALKREMEKGRKIQNDFLPTVLPTVPHCEIAAFFQPALQLSGDFYDVFKLPDNRVGLVIADVSDKGVGSALFMALVRSLIRFVSGHFQLYHSFDNQSEENPNAQKDNSKAAYPDQANILKAVSLTNDYIAHEHGEEGMFATLFFGVIDPSTGLLSYINGGHEPLIIVGAGGIKKRLKPTGPAIGMMPGSNYKIGKAKLDIGDILFGYTDGVTEARSPGDELYTRKRLERSVLNSTLATANGFSENVKSDLFNFIEQAPQSDDITMLTVRWERRDTF